VDEFRPLAFRRWVVGEAEADAVRDGRMVVEQENGHGIRSRVGEIHFTENLECLRGYLA